MSDRFFIKLSGTLWVQKKDIIRIEFQTREKGSESGEYAKVWIRDVVQPIEVEHEFLQGLRVLVGTHEYGES